MVWIEFALVLAAIFLGARLGRVGLVTEKHGPSPKAFLVVPLFGAFFIELVNADVIKTFAAALPCALPRSKISLLCDTCGLCESCPVYFQEVDWRRAAEKAIRE